MEFYKAPAYTLSLKREYDSARTTEMKLIGEKASMQQLEFFKTKEKSETQKTLRFTLSPRKKKLGKTGKTQRKERKKKPAASII